MSGVWHETDVSSADDTDEDVNRGVKQARGVAPTEHLAGGASNPYYAQERAESDWLMGSWPLKSFDGSLPTNKRKAEWIRYRDQFARIVSCKAPANAEMKLTALKIFAGEYLLSIIEMQEKLVDDADHDVYQATVSALNRYFNQTCDASKERMKFREMRMNSSESFSDWVLRLENQAKFCDFGREQRQEEFIQALLRRSVPGIAEKLYEMSDFLGNDLERIINHGKHLDYIRAEANEARKSAEGGSSAAGLEHEERRDTDVRPVNAVHIRKSESGGGHFNRFRGSSRNRFESRYSYSRDRPINPRDSAVVRNCQNCGWIHGPRECKAHRARCYHCDKIGHFAEFCHSPKSSSNSSRKRMHPERHQELKREAGIINQVDDEHAVE